MSKRKGDEDAVTEGGDDPILREIVSDLAARLAKGTGAEATVMGDAFFRAEPKDWISTGIPLLDLAIRPERPSGIPIGKLVEISGEEVTGKSMLLLMILKQAIDAGAIAAYIDAEYASTIQFAKGLIGLDPSKLIHVEIETIEDGFEWAEDFLQRVHKKAPDRKVVLGFDSLVAAPCREERDKAMDEAVRMGAQARAIRRCLKRYTELAARDHSALIWTNQVIADIGAFGPPKKITLGGMAPRYFASLRIQLSTAGSIKSKDGAVIGQKVRATILKSRVGVPWRRVEYPIYATEHDPLGVDGVESLIEFCWKKGLLGAEKGWVTFNGSKMRAKQLVVQARKDATVVAALEALVAQVMSGHVPIEDDDGADPGLD